MNILRLKWGEYWYELISAILRHIATALTGWGGINVAHTSGINVPSLDFKALCIFLVAAGVIPALASFWQRKPLPDVDGDFTITTKTTVERSPTHNPPQPPSAEPKP